MRFFRMKQDTGLSYCVKFRDFDITKGGHLFKKEDYKRINDTTVVFLTGNGHEACPDFIQNPVCMVSDPIKKMMAAYEDELLFRQVILLHQEKKIQHRFYMPFMDEVDAIHSPDQTEKKIVLNAEKIGYHHIFLLKNSRIRDPFLSLAFVESLLRRNVTGILFEEVEVV